jgi:hypothetical protein
MNANMWGGWQFESEMTHAFAYVVVLDGPRRGFALGFFCDRTMT